jgi:hypothetical protein
LAHSGPTSDFGHVGATTSNFDVYVDVNCVNIDGIPGTFMRGATISGVIRRAEPASNPIGAPGDTAFFYIRDGGTRERLKRGGHAKAWSPLSASHTLSSQLLKWSQSADSRR